MNPLLIFLGGALLGGLIGAAASSDKSPSNNLPAYRTPQWPPYDPPPRREVHLHRNTYVQVNHYHYHSGGGGSSYSPDRSRIKASHDEAFQEWLRFKEESSSIGRRMRELYQCAQRPGIPMQERTRVHEGIQELKRLRQAVDAQKQLAHDHWSRERERLIG